ncbi:MAG: hypothetical protein ACLSCV_09100 [Acutalibacteraceae bacterium]
MHESRQPPKHIWRISFLIKGAIATPIGLLALLFRLIGAWFVKSCSVVLGFLIMINMTGAK